MRVALVHDWLNGMRGGEKVLEQFCLLFPDATIHTLLCRPDRISGLLRSHEIRTSFIQSLPFSRTRYRWYLPLFPAAIEQFDLSGYDLVLSSSHCCALGAIASARAVHVCFCYTPMRYAWEHFNLYFPPERFGSFSRALIGTAMSRLRTWEQAAAQRVDQFIAQSHCAAKRIEKRFRRESRVVHPPVDLSRFTPGGSREDSFLVLSALVPYKRIDLAVQAFSRMGRKLIVIGEGPERRRLERMAGPEVTFLGWQSDEVVLDHYRRARALVFPGEEDFGLTPLEAAACGTPTIALGRGGQMETIQAGVTGVFFPETTVDALCRAVEEFDSVRFDPKELRGHAEAFGSERFQQQIRNLIDASMTSSGSR